MEKDDEWRNLVKSLPRSINSVTASEHRTRKIMIQLTIMT